MESNTIRYTTMGICVVLIVVILMAAGACLHSKFSGEPEIVKVNKVDIPNVAQGLSTAGFKLSNQDVGKIVDKIEYRVQNAEPDFKATVPTTKADSTAKDVAKKDGADVVVKEEKPNPTKDQTDMYYYGIHMEKKTGIGLYADLNRDGSYGVHVRRDRTIVEVGKEYTGGGYAARVAYEVIQY